MKNTFNKIIGTIETTLMIVGFMLGILYFYIEYLVMRPFTKKTRKLEE
jgi:hypothetical protein